MRENGFRVFPPIRLGLVLQKDIAVPATTNRFLLSLMLSLEEAQSTSRRRLGLDELLGVNLEDYFNEIAPSDHSSLFIFDQFEEILTIDSAQRAPKQEFFDQVGARCTIGSGGPSLQCGRNTKRERCHMHARFQPGSQRSSIWICCRVRRL